MVKALYKYKMASFCGVSKKEKWSEKEVPDWKMRVGTGFFEITKNEFKFSRWLSKNELRIPIKSTKKVEEGGSHSGMWVGMGKILKITYKDRRRKGTYTVSISVPVKEADKIKEIIKRMGL